MDLAELFRRFGPTARDLRRVNAAVAVERERLKDAIHGLARLTNGVARKDDDVARFVDSSAAVLEAFASEDANVSATVRKLPSALRTTTATLGDVQRFADELGPASDALRPTFEALDAHEPRASRRWHGRSRRSSATRSGRSRARRARSSPTCRRPRTVSRGRCRTSRGRSRRLNHAASTCSPSTRRGARRRTFPGARRATCSGWPGSPTRPTNLINVDDANGPMRPVFLTGTCQTLTNLVQEEPALEFLLGLSGALAQQCDNPQTRSVQPRQRGAPHGAEPVKTSGATRPQLLAMVIFAFSCFGLLLFLWLSFGGSIPLKPKGYRFHVAFPEATTLAEEADVRVVRGVRGQGRPARDATRRATARWRRSRWTVSSRRCTRTRARSCARRRCWARPTSR